MTEAPFRRFAETFAARSSTSGRQRLAWLELRRLFNDLIYRPVWEGIPPTVAEWERTSVSRTRFAPVLEWLEGPGVHMVRELRETLPLREAFHTLERIHEQLLASAKHRLEGLTEASLATKHAAPQPLPESFTRTAAVNQLLAHLRGAPPSIAATLLHGSLADGLVVDGYSDADVLCIIDRPRLGHATFWNAARWLLPLNHHLLAVNPCMHHGPLVVFTAELDFAAEASFPSAVVRNGIWLKGRRDAARYHDGVLEAVMSVGVFEDLFERHFLFLPDLRNAFDVLWWTSSVLLLPILFHQLERGTSIYKRECLDDESANLPAPLWATIRDVSRVRVTLGRWIAERLPLTPVTDQAVNPGEVLAEHRLRLAITPEEVRALGLRDDLLDQTRALWQWIRGRTLELGYQHIGGGSPPPPYTWQWTRPMTAPRLLARADYEDARQTFLERCARRSEIVAVFEFGEIGCPGLSDIDCCVVLDDDFRGLPSDLLATSFAPAIAHVMGHDPLFVSTAMLPTLAALFPIFSARQILGAPMGMALTPSFPRWTQAAAITQKNLNKYPGDLDWLLSNAELDVRTALALLHSTTHIKRSLEMLGIAPAAAIQSALALDVDLRSRFAAGQTLSAADIFAAVRACIACCAPLYAGLIELWSSAARPLPENHGKPIPTGEDAAAWVRAELRAPSGQSLRSGLPTLRPLISEYLIAKEEFINFEHARGRTPSAYIDDQRLEPVPAVPTCKFLTGWHAEERDDTSGSTWRWAMGEALLVVTSPTPGGLTLSARTRAAEFPQDVTWHANGQHIGSWDLQKEGWSEPYTLRIQTDGRPVLLRMIPAFRARVIPPDPRKLSIALRDVSIRAEALP